MNWQDLDIIQHIATGRHGAVYYGTLKYGNEWTPLTPLSLLLYFLFLGKWKGSEVAVKTVGSTIIGDLAEKQYSELFLPKQAQQLFLAEAEHVTTLRHPVHLLLLLRSLDVYCLLPTNFFY